MLKVKKTTYGSLSKNNELTKLTTEIKQAIQIDTINSNIAKAVVVILNLNILYQKKIKTKKKRQKYIKDIMRSVMMMNIISTTI